MARILIADDDRLQLELLERALGRRGHEVEVYADGSSAAEAIEESLAPYDLAVVDLRMPGRSGLEVLQTARKRMPGLRVVIVAGAWHDEDRAAAEAAGAYRLASKPVDAVAVLDLLEEASWMNPDALGRAGGDAARAAAGAGFEGWEPRERSGDDRDAAKAPAAPDHAPGANGANGAHGPNGANGAKAPKGMQAPSEVAPAAVEPPAGDDARAAAPAAAAPVSPATPPQVLIAEPDACQRRLLGYCLERQGFRVVDAESRREAIELAEMDTPEVLVISGNETDMPMEELLRRARKDPTLRSAPVLLLYEAGAVADAVSALDLGADVALERPYEPELVFAHIRAAIRRASPAEARGDAPVAGAVPPPRARRASPRPSRPDARSGSRGRLG